MTSLGYYEVIGDSLPNITWQYLTLVPIPIFIYLSSYFAAMSQNFLFHMCISNT